MFIRTNSSAEKGWNVGQRLNNKMQKTLEKVTSGLKINSAADDSAGLAISEKMRAQISELNQVEKNIGEGIDLTKAADGALAEVNEMLLRANKLCLQAANGTYSETERAAITDEVNNIYEEMDRIFSGSSFNGIQMFRHTGSSIGQPESTWNYNETVTATPPGTLINWGEMEQITDKPFDNAVAAKGGSVTFTFDDSIDMDDATTLIGKSVTIGASYNTYTFGTSTSGYQVGVSAGMSVADAITALCNRYNYYSGDSNRQLNPTETTVNATDRSVTFTFKPNLLQQSITNVNGSTVPYPVQNADGTSTNGITISSNEGASLGQVDGSGTSNNQFTYGTTAATSPFKMMSGNSDGDVLTQNNIDNLKKNTLSVGGYTFSFSDSGGSGSTIGISTSMTVGQLRQAITSAIDANPNLAATLDASGNMTVTRSGLPSNSPAYLYITENLASGSTVNGPADSVGGLGVVSEKTRTASLESPEGYKVTIPSSPTLPFSINIRGSTYTYYNPTNYPASGYTHYSVGGNGRPMTNTSADAIYQQIASDIQSNLGSSAATVTRDGNIITINGNVPNTTLGFSIGTSSATIQSYKIVPGSSSVLNIDTKYFTQDYSIPMNLQQGMGGAGASFDITKLYGKGFNFNGTWYEFNDTSSPLSYSPANRVDISGCTDFDAIMAKLQATMGASPTLTVDAGGILKISAQRTTYNNSPSFADGLRGADGLFTNTVNESISRTTSGGTNATQPQTTIDFSSFSQENLKDLLGKGFRITCATCTGEFINVMFCYDKENSDFPESFEIEDNSQTPSVTRTIRNYGVELKNMTDGASIVRNIVDQLRPNLDHYTDIAVGTPDTTLVVMDKRAGDIVQGGVHFQAQILSGVYTNAEYEVDIEEVPAPPEIAGGGGNGTNVPYRNVLIYAGSHPTSQLIPIHLPYLTLENLNLDPPGVDLSDPDHSTGTQKLIKNAAETISVCRGTLGADQNRLEHASNNTTNTAEQITSAQSRIRDTDMAKMMMEQVQTSILQQSQQAMLAQAIQSPQQVLSLLQ